MNKRLLTIAGMVPRNGVGVIDVGTDHGYLPVHLALNGYTGRLFASDINAMPLAAAKRSARERGAEDRICFLQCNGLALCPPEEVDTIIIAGMGGDLICDILDRAEWCLDPRYTLILQPMTKAEVLRYWLCNNGFVLREERLVRDGAFLYQVIRAEYCVNMPIRDAELFSGAFSNICGEEAAAEWLDSLIRRFEHEARGLAAASEPRPGRSELLEEILSELKSMKGELHDNSQGHI